MTTFVEPPATPELDELQQQRPPKLTVVPVEVHGPVGVHEQPSRRGPAFTASLNTTMIHVLGEDLNRKRAVLMLRSATATDFFLYATNRSSAGVPWPANVPLELTHCDTVYAGMQSGTGTLSVITEVWGS